MNKIKSIHNCHILRGLAALIVVIYHAKFVIWSGGQRYLHDKGIHSLYSYLLFFFDMITSCGRQCVVIFFILSAFFIQYSFHLHQYRLKEFFKIRIIRIYYPYLLSLVFAIISLYLSIRFINPHLTEIHGREFNDRLVYSFKHLVSFSDLLKGLVFVRNQEYPGFNPVYWSLLHEAIFYAFFPVYVLVAKSDKMLFGMFLMAIALFLLLKKDVIYYQIFFIVGLLLYNKLNLILKWVKGIQPILFWIIAIFFILMNFTVKFYGEYLADVVAVMIVILAMGGLILYKRNPPNFLVKLGEVSYSLYLFHFPLLMLQYAIITKIFGGAFYYSRVYYIIAAIAVALTIPLFRITEKPSLLYLKKIKKKRKHQKLSQEHKSMAIFQEG